MKKCKFCGKEFEGKGAKAYCSDECNKEANRMRHSRPLTYKQKDIIEVCIVREENCNGCIYNGNSCKSLQKKIGSIPKDYDGRFEIFNTTNLKDKRYKK